MNVNDVGKTESGPGVDVGVAVGVDVGVAIGVGSNVVGAVGVDVAVGVAFGVIVGVEVAFGVGDGDGDGDAVPSTVTENVDVCSALSAMVIDALPLRTPVTVKVEFETRGETIAIDVSELDAVNGPTYPASLTTTCALGRAALSANIVPPVESE